jgi:hypothetical protein
MIRPYYIFISIVTSLITGISFALKYVSKFILTFKCDLAANIQQAHLQRSFIQDELDYAPEYEREKYHLEEVKPNFIRYTRHLLVAYD